MDRRRLRDRLPGPDALAVDDEEYAVGVRCLAAPVVTVAGSASLGFVTSPNGLRDRTGARRALSTCAARVSRALALG